MTGSLGRRKLFSDLLVRVAQAAEAVRDAEPPPLRPPGALSEDEFLAACTRCEACVDACPEHALLRFAESAGTLAGTPLMLPGERACRMCEGFPCAAACEDGALRVPDTRLFTLGRVRIEPSRCLAFAGPECGACVGLCPGDANALALSRWRPQVDAARCVGCGLCVPACPVDPPAIEFARRDVLPPG